ncbi:MAG: 2-C-methyl-D-erythritol 4-phosphate cytidylyltransferase [Thiofilum sp.]|uniref:2-C-methyl-D-erythritol 4-phosphate cytidylyltransferase n=1 Tax=Thiofilum sp. TaxID=2212733 RepID=UPI0025CC1AC5|nr:2-C-methyl-D-erythritol 4-phosphate cytidylyltransferase [Thiofilum sp.]MBK8453838.1 2-C-methyl-D-erythritol 4-phosphate cytidylyltransferase [Thiofilum sp.]
MSNTKAWVVIPAAGVGKRMQADRPKQYLTLRGKTVLEHTLDCFVEHAVIAGIVVVVSADDPYWGHLEFGHTITPIFRAEGGKERADSVLSGLRYLSEVLHLEDETLVLVHDAARPCLSQTDLNHLVAVAQQNPAGALLGYPVRDTMKRATEQSLVVHTEPRDRLWHALTPQAAPLGVIKQALEQGLAAGTAITDEASALESLGLKPQLVEGDAWNIKITRPSDLALAEILLQLREGD